MISIKHRLFLPAAAALTVTAFFIFTGCSGYIVTEEEETPSTVIGSDVPYQIVITLESDKRTMPFYPGDTITIYWAGSDNISSVCLELYRGDEFVMEITPSYTLGSEYSWIIPDGFTADETYRIKVSDVTDDKPGDLFGFSGYFALRSSPDSGLSDVAVGQRAVTLTLTDTGSMVDGDTVTVRLNSNAVLENHILTGPPGTELMLDLLGGANILEIFAVNEGEVSPNTAGLSISHVYSGEPSQQWRLYTGETGSLVISAH